MKAIEKFLEISDFGSENEKHVCFSLMQGLDDILFNNNLSLHQIGRTNLLSLLREKLALSDTELAEYILELVFEISQDGDSVPLLKNRLNEEKRVNENLEIYILAGLLGAKARELVPLLLPHVTHMGANAIIVNAITRIGITPEQILPDMRKFLGIQDYTSLYMVSYLAVSADCYGHPEFFRIMQEGSESLNGSVRGVILDLIDDLGYPEKTRYRPILENLLGDPEEAIRQQARKMLEQW